MTGNFDSIIVGSGPLGTVVARRLAEQGQEVLILEEGPAVSEPAGAHLRNERRFQERPNSYLESATGHLAYINPDASRKGLPGAAVTKAVGGQGVIWTNLCPRCDAPWEALSPKQWDSYSRLAEAYLGVQSDDFEASIRQQKMRAKLNAYFAPAGRSVETLPTAASYQGREYLHYCGPHDILQGAGQAAARIKVKRGAVTSLSHKGGRVTAVQVGQKLLRADQFILAAGAIGTPRLLHLSRIRPKALGRWLSYHPILITQMVLDRDLCAASGDFDRVPRLQIRPTPAAPWFSLVLQDVSPFEPRAPDDSVDPNRLAEIQGICPIDVCEEKGVFFSENGALRFHVPLSPEDESRLAGAMEDAREITAALGRCRRGCDPIWTPFGFAHMTGTTRMSAVDDGTGVTDFRGRVWGFDNLRLATNGLIPTRMAVNPTLTGVALAIWVADGILAS